MNKTFLIAGGVAVVGIVGYMLYKRKQALSEDMGTTMLDEKSLETSLTPPPVTPPVTPPPAMSPATPPPPIVVAPNLAQQGRKEIRQCRKEARKNCGIGLSYAKKTCRRNFRNQCIAEGGIDEGGEDFAFGFSSEDSVFAFNGLTF
jgi:hypothetical protein